MSNKPEFYTVDEVREIMRAEKRDTVYNMCRAGEIPAIQFNRGGKWLIPKDKFHRMLEHMIDS
ncbi:MAG: Helix-turn-helix domain [Neobacillus sp.]|nr:Helix-turn-helix domain [Neobacillus sp.]